MIPHETDGARPGAPSPALLRLLVVDADRRVRASLAGLLDLAEQVEVVGSAGLARAALDVCRERLPDVVVVDPRLPELPDGIAFIRGLRAAQPQVRVVVVAWSPSLATILQDDPGIAVVSPDGGDLADRILEALRAPASAGGDPGSGADAMLEATA
jgi:DNA-binding NarL/FixJ family response regulator